jgi:hypothetical protein
VVKTPTFLSLAESPVFDCRFLARGLCPAATIRAARSEGLLRVTLVLAIAALLAGRAYGWLRLDPLIAIVGALAIARWSWGLLTDAGSVLVDYLSDGEDLPAQIRETIEGEGGWVTDALMILGHIHDNWRGHHAQARPRFLGSRAY